MKLLQLGKVIVHFLYKNNFIETSILVAEDDTTLNVLGRTIKKNTAHAFIDSKGKKHYFINGQATSTSIPYKHFMNNAEFDELDREALHATLKTNLLKSMASLASQNMFMTVMILLAGVGVGYVLGTEYGGDQYTDVTNNNNYNQQTPKDNDTIVIGSQMQWLKTLNIWEDIPWLSQTIA